MAFWYFRIFMDFIETRSLRFSRFNKLSIEFTDLIDGWQKSALNSHLKSFFALLPVDGFPLSSVSAQKFRRYLPSIFASYKRSVSQSRWAIHQCLSCQQQKGNKIYCMMNQTCNCTLLLRIANIQNISSRKYPRFVSRTKSSVCIHRICEMEISSSP